ncbi:MULTISPECIES: ABC transporter permease [Acinetobacter]|uniref:ABC transporter permease n=1 Tax=Acinetobacter tianfuensis TaxID=2419603 RepID=A0A3A8EME3_9GAMM|nr:MULTISPECIES: FtsX-like permease family protein [Acinetobacter]MCL6244374.1 ABC transporter permease [Acinetobacter amyesii]MDM1271442.1 ABC transporter permease [Acinetobacter indicus]MDM1276305.1 ABC transporter permease [Acinetobacter indicus]MDM1276677.1 ABC transporter permease [Acinetobacter indicus]MDM1279598.1 ABC transporter permease [Acinetobacter indicus]
MKNFFRRLWTEWTIAISFLREGRTQSMMITIGVAVGVAVIVFISALIQGLQSNIVERTLGTQAHIRLLSPDEVNHIVPPAAGTLQLLLEDQRAQRLRSINNWQQITGTLDHLPVLTAVSPVVSGPAFVQRGDAIQSVALVGINLERYQQIIPLKQYMVSGELRVSADNVLIGRQLAKDLGVQVGSKLRLDTGQQKNAVVNISGIFELGVRELDARYVYLDLKQAQSLLNLPGGVTVIDLTIQDIFQAEQIASQVGRLAGLKAESWIETNAQLMNAITAQSLSTNMIIVFVGISVAFGIASVMSVSVVQRTREIGILRATGATQTQILRVFLFQGAIFGLLGSMLGSVVSYCLIWGFNQFGPGLFYISISIKLILSALFLATLTGVLAAAIPSRRAAALDPVEAIRHV